MTRRCNSLLLVLGVMAFCMRGVAQPDIVFERANLAYESGDHEEALALYESIAEGHLHFESEFNAGMQRSNLTGWDSRACITSAPNSCPLPTSI